MIWILGYGVYFLVLVAALYIPAVSGMLEQGFLLAPEITLAMLCVFLVPLFVFTCHFFTQKNKLRHRKLLYSQSLLCSSLSVSLGLIGTFVGLTDMVTAIASSMGGEGDIVEKMGGMIDSISNALSAMSYAFLTSILGVAVSVLILLSLNFWSFFYEGQEDKNEKGVETNAVNIYERLSSIEKINTEIVGKLTSIPLIEVNGNEYLDLLKDQVEMQKERDRLFSIYMEENSLHLQQLINVVRETGYSVLRESNAMFQNEIVQIKELLHTQNNIILNINSSIDDSRELMKNYHSDIFEPLKVTQERMLLAVDNFAVVAEKSVNELNSNIDNAVAMGKAYIDDEKAFKSNVKQALGFIVNV